MTVSTTVVANENVAQTFMFVVIVTFIGLLVPLASRDQFKKEHPALGTAVRVAIELGT